MSDLDNLDHAAEHHATTGSDVCWCNFPECERRAASTTTLTVDPADDAQVARLARAYVQAYHTLPWGGVDADDHVRTCMRVALLHEANAEGGVACPD